MAAAKLETHHRVPRYLLRMFDWKTDCPEHAGEFAREAEIYGIDAGISRDELEAMVEASVVELSRDEHRFGEHAGDWSRWGRRGGMTTFERYGAGWFALLARRRWKRVRVELLQEYRARVAEGVAS